MSFSTLKLVVGPFPPAARSNESYVKGLKLTAVKRTLLPLQMRIKEEQKLKTPEALLAVSRRDLMLGLGAASMSGLIHFLTEPVEARVVKPENRRKILEKLKMLREKAGMSKPKAEDEKAPASNSLGMDLQSLRNPLKDPVESLVEAVLPR